MGTRSVFNTWLMDAEMLSLLEDCEIETATKFELFDVLDVDMGGTLGVNELVGGLMRLRGPVSKSDIVAVRLKVRYITELIEELWTQVCEESAAKAGKSASCGTLSTTGGALSKAVTLYSSTVLEESVRQTRVTETHAVD